ncbi:hypothetical protein YN1_7700 [Nanoarchaeota archaeon]
MDMKYEEFIKKVIEFKENIKIIYKDFYLYLYGKNNKKEKQELENKIKDSIYKFMEDIKVFYNKYKNENLSIKDKIILETLLGYSIISKHLLDKIIINKEKYDIEDLDNLVSAIPRASRYSIELKELGNEILECKYIDRNIVCQIKYKE